MNAFVEGHVCAPQRIERERADDIRRVGQDLGRKQRQNSDCQHRLRPVDQGDASLASSTSGLI